MSETRDSAPPSQRPPGGGVPDEPMDSAIDAAESEAMRALLKRALGPGARSDAKGDVADEAPPPDLLEGVQRKIRHRSKGKFYADGWSTTQSRANYALIAIVMLLLVGVVYFVLGPMGFSAR